MGTRSSITLKGSIPSLLFSIITAKVYSTKGFQKMCINIYVISTLIFVVLQIFAITEIYCKLLFLSALEVLFSQRHTKILVCTFSHMTTTYVLSQPYLLYGIKLQYTIEFASKYRVAINRTFRLKFNGRNND